MMDNPKGAVFFLVVLRLARFESVSNLHSNRAIQATELVKGKKS